ncbi:MAG: peptide MFS transporter [Acidobacteriota bacterium]|nr:peptide MFS transporter [Acidobacteriota bacterium]
MNSESIKTSSNGMDTGGIGGHPRGLSTLFFTEMWERFSYYGMRAILVLYMTQALQFADEDALSIYGYYTASVYFLPIFGGWLADRFLGAKRAVLFGGIVIACGHFSLAFSPLPFFYTGLVLVAIGTGLLKPNISTMVGDLYSENDSRRDSGFSLFYMGINLGAFIAPLVCGYLGQNVNWHYGFAAAGIGMIFGLLQFVLSGNRLKNIGEVKTKYEKSDIADKPESLTKEEIKRLAVIAILFFFSAIFWMAFEQSGSSLTLFADRLTRNSFFGYEFPSSWFQVVQPLCLILLAPVFAHFWLRLGERQPSSPRKFMFGLFFVGLSYILLIYAATLTGAGRVSPLWLVFLYLIQTFGELCLSPVGLSTVTKLAPARMVGLMMGVWFLSISLGSFLAGKVASYFYDKDIGAMVKFFGFLTIAPIATGILLAVLIPQINKLLRHEKQIGLKPDSTAKTDTKEENAITDEVQ